MKKNLLNEEAAISIIERVNKLTLANKPVWGEMSVTEMLLHCNSCNKQILEESRGNKKTSLSQYLLRILALYLAPRFKKGLQSEERHILKGKISDADFEKQKAAFIDIIKKFPVNKKNLSLTHPAFGNISTNQWGIAAYKHMDHHLRQFAV